MHNHPANEENSAALVEGLGPKLLTAAKLAASMDISTRTLWRLLASSKLPKPIRLGGCVRWRAQEIEQWIADGCPMAK